MGGVSRGLAILIFLFSISTEAKVPPAVQRACGRVIMTMDRIADPMARCVIGARDCVRTGVRQVAAAARPYQLRRRYGKFHSVSLQRQHIRLLEAIPDYQPESEVLFTFREDGHAQMYFGDYFWDVHNVDPGHRSIVYGVVVRLKVGKEIVAALEDSVREKRHQRGTYSCHHTTLLFLLRHGVHLAGGMPFLGSDVYRRAMREGFRFEDGSTIPQEVYLIHHGDENLIEQLDDRIQLLTLQWFGSGSQQAGLTEEDLKKKIATAKDPKSWERFLGMRAHPGLYLRPSERAPVLDWMRAIEPVLKARVEASPLRPEGETFATAAEWFPQEELREILLAVPLPD